MGQIRSYRDLTTWRKARALVKNVYELTKLLPAEDLYGLTRQIRRAAVSVPSNIAEGYGRGSRKDYMRFLQMGRGSLYELETQLLPASDLGYVDQARMEPVLAEVGECSRLLHGLLRSLRANETTD